MAMPTPFPVRLHAHLVRALVPSLGPVYTEQASLAFADLYGDARHATLPRRARLLWREARALVGTAWRARRPAGDPETVRDPRAWWPGGVEPVPGGPRPRGTVRARADSILRDLRYAVRNLGRSPVFTAVAIGSLTVGITAATVLFSVVNGSLIRAPRYVTRGDQLVSVRALDGRGQESTWSYPEFGEVRNRLSGLADAAVVGGLYATVETPAGRESLIPCEQASADYFEVLGARMTLGSPSLAQDTPAGPDVVIIGHRLWMRGFSGDPAVVGRTLRVNGRPRTIVGVAPRGMLAHDWPPAALDLWTPIDPRWRASRELRLLTLVGRLREGTTRRALQAELDVVAGRMGGASQQAEGTGVGLGVAQMRALPYSAGSPADPDARAPLMAVGGALAALVGLTILVICANVGNMLLMRATEREREFAIRLALGADPGRLVSQLTVESLVLSGVAGALGLLLTHLVTSYLASGRTSVVFDFTVDARVTAFALVVATATALAFGLAPALRAARTDLVSAIKSQATGLRLRRWSLRNTFVLVQVAGALVTVAGAGLLVRSVHRVTSVDVGYEAAHVVVMPMSLPAARYREAAGRQFFADLVGRVQAVPGVEGAALARAVPLGHGFRPAIDVWLPGTPAEPKTAVDAGFNVVGPGFFRVIRTPVLRGREFRATDTASSPRVVVVNEALARRLWPAGEPVGQQLVVEDPAAQINGGPDGGPSPHVLVEVVGVVRDAKYNTPLEPPTPHLWSPASQAYCPQMTLHVRVAGAPSASMPGLRAQVRALDPALAVAGMETLERVNAVPTSRLRTFAWVFLSVGAVTLALAVTGIYGVVAYATSLRRREMGIRVALGASPGRIARSVLGESLTVALGGIGVGLALVAGGGRLVASLVVGVSPHDPLALGGAVLILAGAAAGAALSPALRAARVDPVETLRSE